MDWVVGLNYLWFLLVGVLFTGYAVLDGFDLGAGALHLFAKTDTERRVVLNAIGPVWDGNEVWLVSGGGALFAAFPRVYATVFSGFYLAFILLLFSLIFRAVAIEFRSKQDGKRWRSFWDASFSVSSTSSALLIGVAVGNIVLGIPLDAQGNYTGGFLGLLRPYPLLVGATTVALFAMHGGLYLLLKTEGDLHERLRRLTLWATGVFVFFYAATTVATLVSIPHMTDFLRRAPALGLVAILNLLAVLNIPVQLGRRKDLKAFFSSALAIVALMSLFGFGMFPNLVYSWPQVQNSLTFLNAASSPKTLWIMTIVALIGMPLVVSYTTFVYWTFRGKVKVDEHSY